ncbi:mechanosensitive ion channel family protein [Thalassococcus sp. BH17M4-6]|uniref:mechanosensitive ion channel family protein n=1 Tax=Thalassococcus sp. BH17M4-6 TaxID=3413148 RepID=UPI003BF49CDE
MKLLSTCLFCALFITAQAVAAQESVYEIDSLNTGLDSPPDTLDRSSPHAVMEAMLDLTDAGDFNKAAHLLNLANIPPGRQSAEGPQLAEKLATLIDRKVVISWGSLLDRPDALDATATSKSAVAGQERRSILLWVLDIDDRPYPIYLDRVRVGEDAPVWIFSRRSVANIDKLYDVFGPSKLERKLPDWARQDGFWNLMWWEVIGLPVMLLIAALGGLLTYRAMSRAAASAGDGFVERFVSASRLPAVLFVITLIISIISGIFVFSGPVATLIPPVIALGYVMSALLFVVNAVDRVIDQLVMLDDDDLRLAEYDGLREKATKVSLARRILIVIIFLLGLGIVLAEANLFRTFGFSLLASAGAATLVLGFAAREVLSNIMSSMQIALNQSARIGDKVVYDGHICTVERINFTYVLLRVWTGVRLVVPVTEFVSETFQNWTIKEPQMIREIEVHVAHDAEIAQLRDLFFEVLKEVDQDQVGSKEDHQVLVTGQDVFGQIVTFCVACANPNTSWELSCDVRERLIRRMQELQSDGTQLFPDANPAEGA